MLAPTESLQIVLREVAIIQSLLTVNVSIQKKRTTYMHEVLPVQLISSNIALYNDLRLEKCISVLRRAI